MVEEAISTEKNNGNTFWQDASAKKMGEVKVAFQIFDNGKKAPNNYQFVNCHIVFNIKMENFRRACLVVGGYRT